MRLTIAGKIAIMVVLVLLCSNAANTLVTMRLMEPPLDDSVDSTIHIIKTMTSHSYDAMVKEYREQVTLVAAEHDTADAVRSGDAERVRAFADALRKRSGAGLVTISDARGVVLGRGHSSRAGDNVSEQATVAAAMRGEIGAGIVKGLEVPYSLRATAPVKDGDRIIGTISMGIALDGEAYIDSLKTHPDVDVTLFHGNRRAMTTLKQDGRRIIGTSLDDPEILNRVLRDGGEYYGTGRLAGISYRTAYWPVKDAAGSIVGMWFLGFNLSKIEADKSRAATMSTLTGLGIVLVFMIVAFVVGGMIASPVRKITAFAAAVAGGDMDARLDVRSSDETADLSAALRTMVGNLRDRIAEAARQSALAEEGTQKAQAAVRAAEEAQARAESARREGILHAAEQLAGVSAASSNAAHSLSAQIQRGREGASHQAERLAETATAMEEMNAAVLEVARTAGNASDVSNQTRIQAEHGADVARQAVADIQAVRDQSLKLMEGMRELDGVSRSISQVMNVISDIADQTNLLALNAAIEAARAGEAGRGFAVVADEVRKLAEKTMTSTTDVGHAIKSIQESAARSVAQVEQTVGQIEQSTARVTESGEALARIVDLAESTADQVRGIAAASEEQSASSDEINRSISDVSGISEETLEAMNEAERAVNDLAGQIRALTDLIEEMKRA